MKKTAVLLYPKFCEYELIVTLSILGQGGKPIETIACHKQPIKGEAGLTCLPDTIYAEADPEAYDSVLLSGIMEQPPPEDEAACVDFLRRLAAKGGVVFGAISAAPYLLARAGVLDGKRYAAGLYEEAIDEMGMNKALWAREESLVEDGNVITAHGRAFIPFGVAVGKALGLAFENWYGA